MFELQNVRDLNMLVRNLSNGGKGFPRRIDLHTPDKHPGLNQVQDHQTQQMENQIQRLKEQNKMLTQEVWNEP